MAILCKGHGTIRHNGGWYTTTPEDLEREGAKRDAERAFAPTVRRRDGRIEKIRPGSPSVSHQPLSLKRTA